MHDVSPELALVDDALAERERGRLPDPGDCLAPRLAAETRVASPPTLTLLSPASEPAIVEVEPEPAELIEPGHGPMAERASEVLQPEGKPAPVEDAGPKLEERGDAVGEPTPDGPMRMPEWVASDLPPKSRRTRRKDRARERRDARGERPRAARRRVAVAASWVVLCGFLASPLLAFIPSPSGERPTLAPDGVESVPDAGDDAGHALRWDPVPKAAGYSVVFVNDGVRSDRWSQGAELRLPAGTESERLVTYEWFVYPAFRDGAGYRYGPLVASGEVTMPMLAPTESS